MKYVRGCLIGLAALLLAAIVLVWFVPARWVLPRIEPRLHGLQLQQVHGLLWNGRADRVVTADGIARGRLRWRLSRRALLGQVRLQLDFDGPALAFSGSMRRPSADRLEWSGVKARSELDVLPARFDTPLGRPRGEVTLAVASAVLQGGWPLQLQAQARWRQAVMRTNEGDVALGNLQLQARATNGVLDVQLGDDGSGPLQLAGQLQLSPLGWRLDATLHPRQPDPGLRQWLSGIGQADAHGTVHLQRSGGLAASRLAGDPEESASP